MGNVVCSLLILALGGRLEERVAFSSENTADHFAHHQVQAFIIGPNNQGRDVALLVDTGASTVVLLASMSTQLGFQPGDLEDGVAQTASDRVAAKLGVLKSVRVGEISVNDVKVTFISDDRLGNTMLLGMSFLERFNVTIDDAHNALILLTK